MSGRARSGVIFATIGCALAGIILLAVLSLDGRKNDQGTVDETGGSIAADQPEELVTGLEVVAQAVVCLDPGHADTPSRIDPGTGLNTMDYVNEPEIQIVYDIALRAKDILEDQGIKVVMTKQSVYDGIDLMQRGVIANEVGAALILHIHSDPAVSAPTTFYPGGDEGHNWKGNTQSGRVARIDPEVQAASYRLASVFHAAMAETLSGLLAAPDGGLRAEDRGATGTGNYGPVFSYDIWSEVPTFTIENNQAFADLHRQEIALSIAEGILACLR